MIKGIASGNYINVIGGSPSVTYIGNYSNQPGIGNLRYNPNTQNTEVWDGTTWMTMLSSYATVELNQEAQSLLDWARVKRAEEYELNKVIEQHPGVKDLKEKLDIMVALVQKQSKQGE